MIITPDYLIAALKQSVDTQGHAVSAEFADGIDQMELTQDAYHEFSHVLVYKYFGDPIAKCRLWRGCEGDLSFSQTHNPTTNLNNKLWRGQAQYSAYYLNDYESAVASWAGPLGEALWDNTLSEINWEEIIFDIFDNDLEGISSTDARGIEGHTQRLRTAKHAVRLLTKEYGRLKQCVDKAMAHRLEAKCIEFDGNTVSFT